MNIQLLTTLYLLLLISLGYVATDIYLPSLPAMGAYFHAENHEVQRTLFFYLISFSLAPLICGPLSDHIGRKRVILGGLFVAFIATLGCLFSESIEVFIACQCIQGMGTGAVLISGRASLPDLFEGKALAKQMSLATMLMPLILSISPALGGALQQNFQWHAITLFLLGWLLFLCVVALLRKETQKQKSTSPLSQIFSHYRTHLKNPIFLMYGVNFILPAIGLFSYMTVSPFLFQKTLGLSPLEYGSLAFYVGGTILVTGYLNLKLLNHFSTVQILHGGALLMVLSGALLLIFHWIGFLTTWSVLGPSLIFFTCMPLCVSNAAAKAFSLVRSHFGAATALLSCLQFLIGALGSFVSSLFSYENALLLAVLFFGIGCISLVNLTLASRLEKRLAYS